MSNLTTIIEAIKADVKPAMDEWVQDTFNYIREREEIKRGMYKTDEYKQLKQKLIDRDYGGYAGSYAAESFKARHGITSTMETRFFGLSDVELTKRIQKEADHKLLKIDVAVAKKLAGVDVQSFERIDFSTSGKDVYVEGAWKINGDKVFSFRTIYAGGWNIQQLHVRTLYKFK